MEYLARKWKQKIDIDVFEPIIEYGVGFQITVTKENVGANENYKMYEKNKLRDLNRRNDNHFNLFR